MLLKDKCNNLRRKIWLKNLIGITLSYHEESFEMVIHADSEPDLRISSPGHRKQMIDSIKMFYATLKRQNLPIYGVRQKNLGAYTTQAGDVAKGISRVPLPLARLNDQDLIRITTLEKERLTNVPMVRTEHSGGQEN